MLQPPKQFVLTFLLSAALPAPALSADAFAPTTPLSEGFTGHALVQHNGFLYQIGGLGASGAAGSNRTFFAPITGPGQIGAWSAGPNLPAGLFFHTAAASNNFIYAAGGQRFEGGVSLSNRVYVAGASAAGFAGNWTATTPLPEALFLQAMAVWQGRLYVLGGFSSAGLSPRVYSSVISADGTLSAWTRHGDLPQPVYSHVSVQDGALYVLGGLINNGQSQHNGVSMAPILADGSVGAWSDTTPLPEPLSNHSAVVAKGQIFVLGGYSGSGPTAAVRVAAIRSDKTLGDWQDGPPLPAPSYLASAAVAERGIFLAGGSNGSAPSAAVWGLPLPPDAVEAPVASVDWDPDVLNLLSHGQWVKAIVEFPPSAASAAQIDPASMLMVRVNGAAVAPLSPDPKHSKLGDEDADGIADLTLKFSRLLTALRLAPGDNLIELEGRLLDGRSFTAKGSIRTKRFEIVKKIVKLIKQHQAHHRRFLEVSLSSRAALGFVDDDGHKVVNSVGAAVEFPAGAAAGAAVTVSCDDGLDASETARRAAAMKAKGLAAAGEPFKFGPHGAVFAKEVTLELPYDPASLPAGTDESGLQVHYWNETQSRWEALVSAVDTAARRVRAKTTHFSSYQVFGGGAPASGPGPSIPGLSIDSHFAYPNPARGETPKFRIAAPQAERVELRIYDLSGELRHGAELRGPTAQFDYAWDVSGAGSGIYYYVVTAHKDGVGTVRARGKVAVIK